MFTFLYGLQVGDPTGLNVFYRGEGFLLRGGLGVGGVVSYLNMQGWMGVSFVKPVGNLKTFVGVEGVMGFRIGKGMGVGIRIPIGGFFRGDPKSPLMLGADVSPGLVVVSASQAHPSLSVSLHIVHSPPEEKGTVEEVVERRVPVSGEGTKENVVNVERKKRPTTAKKTTRRTGSTDKSPPKQREQKVDEEAADREYKRGLQAYAEGDLERALKHFEAALRYNPKHEKARRALERVRNQLGK